MEVKNRSDCNSIIINLIPQSNPRTQAYQYRRSQDFYILSTIKFNCNKTLSTIQNWSIKNSTNKNFSEIEFDKKIVTSRSELYIPSNTLQYGIYRLELRVTIEDNPSITSSSSVYVEISPSGVTANLVPLGTSVVTSGDQQNLILNPGNYSKDPDGFEFNSSDWKYEYFCRFYPPVESLVKINVFFNLTQFEYKGNESSLTIFANVLKKNLEYQFVVQMSNRRNISLQATGYVIVQVQDSTRPMIAIG